ncbi:hypothetical protein [Cellulophaga sp. Hel_I_12]|uniref:hypothetical protein n=1 Tax=Cellulophaga sp. Hel_I_12 TaxID=1249972 RepID=UPI0006454BEF|nr:hypothetical protein [Cellulophaga sp. Hel_I_12]
MKKVLILTKTNWSEPPRIRHQITRLLKEKNFEITYLEKNSYKSLIIKKREEEGITFFSHSELIHHQLRYFPFIQKLNNLIVKFYLKKIMQQIEFEFIMNFSYEYSFLKTLAPEKKIISIMEDDFEEQAKFGMTKQIRNQIKTTCENSDAVLTVSYPLFRKLSSYKNNVTMLFPWSQRKYESPLNSSKKRHTILYFGFVGRLDWLVLEELVKSTNYNYRFVGPTIGKTDDKMIQRLSQNNNFEYIKYSTLDQLKTDDLFCSILPYNPNLGNVQACTVSNRAFNLLSLGLPLVYADLRNLIKAPNTIIRANKTIDDYKETLDFYNNNFFEIQNDIELFLKDHYKENRWEVLNRVINE